MNDNKSCNKDLPSVKATPEEKDDIFFIKNNLKIPKLDVDLIEKNEKSESENDLFPATPRYKKVFNIQNIKDTSKKDLHYI